MIFFYKYSKKNTFIKNIFTKKEFILLRQYFTDHNINLRAFAKTHELDYQTLFKVVNGKLTGARNTKGSTREVYEKLLELKIIKALPKGLSKKASA